MRIWHIAELFPGPDRDPNADAGPCLLCGKQLFEPVDDYFTRGSVGAVFAHESWCNPEHELVILHEVMGS